MSIVAAHIRLSCSDCSLRRLCLPAGLSDADIGRLEALVSPAFAVRKEQTLFSQGDPLSALYAVSNGSVKTVVVDESGLEQIVGFHYAGDILGLDGIAEQTHRCSAVALEKSAFCRIPFERFDQLSGRLPGLRRQFVRLMSHSMSEDDWLLLTLGRKSSEARLASWLLGRSRQLARFGEPSDRLRLTMSRTDLANFLGMRIETISRVLSRFHARGVLRVCQRTIDILDFGVLSESAARSAHAADR